MEKLKKINRTQLKILIMIAMLIDHLAHTIFISKYNMNYDIYEFMRGIGRLAFPLYCFLFVEGMYYTRNRTNYGLRLLGLALISEVIYDNLFHGGLSLNNQNILFMYALGVLIFYTLKEIRKGTDYVLWVLCTICFMAMSSRLNLDYGAGGALLISVLYLIRFSKGKFIEKYKKIFQMIVLMVLDIYQAFGWGKLVYLTGPIALLYNDDKVKENKRFQTFSYIFYPAHLLLLYILRIILLKASGMTLF